MIKMLRKQRGKEGMEEKEQYKTNLTIQNESLPREQEDKH
jgi:hypothetical protein